MVTHVMFSDEEKHTYFTKCNIWIFFRDRKLKYKCIIKISLYHRIWLPILLKDKNWMVIEICHDGFLFDQKHRKWQFWYHSHNSGSALIRNYQKYKETNIMELTSQCRTRLWWYCVIKTWIFTKWLYWENLTAKHISDLVEERIIIELFNKHIGKNWQEE